MKEVNQAIYDEVFKTSLKLGYSTFNYLSDKTDYPFVYLGEQFDNTIQVKSNSNLIGTSIVTLHVYADKAKRRQVTDMLQDLIKQAKLLKMADDYSISFADNKIQVLQDNSTATMLWHGILELEFNYAN